MTSKGLGKAYGRMKIIPLIHFMVHYVAEKKRMQPRLCNEPMQLADYVMSYIVNILDVNPHQVSALRNSASIIGATYIVLRFLYCTLIGQLATTL